MQEENSKKRKNDQDDEPTGKKKRGPKEKKVKDKDAPRRAPSAYLIFQNEIRRKTKEQNPNIPNNELLQMISKKWSDLPSEERQVSSIIFYSDDARHLLPSGSPTWRCTRS